jgi:uncharacterized protein YajQ (UPF0234 family)
MPAESTFDIVSEFDQTQRELRTRYDLKDSGCELVLNEKEVVITAESDMLISSVRDILETKTLRRNLSLKIFKRNPVEQIAGGRVRQVLTLQQGIPEDVSKRLQKMIRDQYPKVQPRIQGEALRVGSKSRDELQSVIRLVREHQDDFSIPLQFTNYR